MATPGHPFETKDLDKKRARQRRQLRMIQRWVLDRVPLTPAPEVTLVDRPIVENTLRDLADEEWQAIRDGELAEFVELMAEAETYDAVVPFLERVQQGRMERRPSEMSAEFANISQRFYEQKKRRPDRLPDSKENLARMITVLIWADELAGDYQDPRLGGPDM